MKQKILLAVIGMLLGIQMLHAQQKAVLSGIVRDSVSGEILPGVTVLLEGTSSGTVTDENGSYQMLISSGEYSLVFSYLGYEPQRKEIILSGPQRLDVVLVPKDIGLAGVDVLATGYQTLPASRASGSFVALDEELLDRRISTNLLDRLEDVTPGLIFNRTGDAGRDPISIRGRSTLGRFNQPLFVIDNFAFDGELEDINPNDVATITVLRDAAAASIWGARAGNGVIVITTKSGKSNQKLRVELTSNINWIESPNALNDPIMGAGDYIDMEQQLFESGFYNSQESSPNHPALTPVVETLILQRDGLISEAEAESRINQMRQYSFQKDINRYLNQAQLNQQYNLGLTGGGKNHGFRISLGYDSNKGDFVGNRSRRYTLNMRENLSLLNDRLKLDFSFYGTKLSETVPNSSLKDMRLSTTVEMYPYARLADESGNPLELNTDLRNSFKREAEEQGLLDWAFTPLDERNSNQTQVNRNDLRINLGADYELIKGLHLKGLYQYWENSNLRENLQDARTYQFRNMVNLYTQVSETGLQSYPIPRTAILNSQTGFAQSHSGRMMLEYKRSFRPDLQWDILAGGEIKSLNSQSHSTRLYGYNPELASTQAVDYYTAFARYSNPRSTLTIPFADSKNINHDRFVSVFANTSLSWKNRYLLTGSVRRDASNLFGVGANLKSVPLWSAGLAWTISEEDFYHWEKLPYLKLRMSYGYNGNVDRSLTAFTTAQVITFNTLTNVNYAQIINPPNENLRWERIRIVNLGLDWESKSSRLSGSLEFYQKSGLDLIGMTPYAPSTGISTFTGNTASTRTHGYDLTVNTRNLRGEFQWNTFWILSGVKERVTDYELDASPTSLINYGVSGRGGEYFPIKGKPLFAVYSYPWAGLNPETGAPMGYLDGNPSEEYRNIVNTTDMDQIQYHGSARPTTFGALRNDFEYKGIHLSVNISYRLGYYSRRSSVAYAPILQGRGGHSDFAGRWQEPGDELWTQIPSMPETRDTFRDRFYAGSSVLVEKGDHIRLQDIRLGYDLTRIQGALAGFQKAEIFLYANNLGMIWKATDTDWDPDFGTYKPLRSIAGGLRLNF